MHFDLLLWLGVSSTLLGAIGRSLSADGAASLLDHFAIAWRLPKAALAALILFCGFGSGVADSMLAGQDLQHALATAAIATVGALFGATYQHGRVGSAIVIIFFAVLTAACGALLKEAKTLTIDMGLCLQKHADMPDDQAFELCGIEEALREAGRPILASEREKRAELARAAAERAEHDLREKMTAAGCDGGSR